MTSLGPSRRPRNARAAEPIKYVPKGWGYEKWIANCEKYCGKLLFIAKDKQCSWHYHKLKDEVFFIQSGKIKLYLMAGLMDIRAERKRLDRQRRRR